MQAIAMTRRLRPHVDDVCVLAHWPLETEIDRSTFLPFHWQVVGNDHHRLAAGQIAHTAQDETYRIDRIIDGTADRTRVGFIRRRGPAYLVAAGRTIGWQAPAELRFRRHQRDQRSLGRKDSRANTAASVPLEIRNRVREQSLIRRELF